MKNQHNSRFQLNQLVKSLIVEQEIKNSNLAYIKN